jgi:hypothetical protein
LVEIYGAAFPAERAEVTRVFVVTTFGATVNERRGVDLATRYHPVPG